MADFEVDINLKEKTVGVGSALTGRGGGRGIAGAKGLSGLFIDPKALRSIQDMSRVMTSLVKPAMFLFLRGGFLKNLGSVVATASASALSSALIPLIATIASFAGGAKVLGDKVEEVAETLITGEKLPSQKRIEEGRAQGFDLLINFGTKLAGVFKKDKQEFNEEQKKSLKDFFDVFFKGTKDINVLFDKTTSNIKNNIGDTSETTQELNDVLIENQEEVKRVSDNFSVVNSIILESLDITKEQIKNYSDLVPVVSTFNQGLIQTKDSMSSFIGKLRDLGFSSDIGSLGAGLGKTSNIARAGLITGGAVAEAEGFTSENVGGGWTRWSPP